MWDSEFLFVGATSDREACGGEDANLVHTILRRERLASVPGQLCTPSRLLRVCINRCRGNVLFEPAQLGYSKVIDLPLNIFGFLGASVSVMCNNHPLEVVLNKGIQSAEGGPEGGGINRMTLSRHLGESSGHLGSHTVFLGDLGVAESSKGWTHRK